jgi:hypothetical protein
MFVCIRLSPLFPLSQHCVHAPFTSSPSPHDTGLPPEASAWAGVSVVNLKNNKVLDVGTLPGFWPELTRLYLGEHCISCRILLCARI